MTLYTIVEPRPNCNSESGKKVFENIRSSFWFGVGFFWDQSENISQQSTCNNNTIEPIPNYISMVCVYHLSIYVRAYLSSIFGEPTFKYIRRTYTSSNFNHSTMPKKCRQKSFFWIFSYAICRIYESAH